MMDAKKIHFINRIDRENVGDWYSSPLEYYYEYFKRFNIIRHDIGSVDYHEIERDDLVILGGGGLFNVLDPFNRAINNVLKLCDNVIAWGCGFNTHNERLQGDSEFEPLDMNRFRLVTIRDYDHPSGIEYLPCVSVKALHKDRSRKPIRRIGVLYHRQLTEIANLPFDSLSNNESISRINDFILDSEAIVTNSYHCAYWALLHERKAIVVNKFSSKFDYLKYKPEFVEISPDDLDGSVALIEKAFEKALIYSGIMEEAETQNDAFFERVKGIVEELGFPHSNDYQSVYLLNTTKDIKISNLQGQVSVLNDSVMWIYDKLAKLAKLEQSCIQKEQYLEKKCTDLQQYIIRQQILRLTKGKRLALTEVGVHTPKTLELLGGEAKIGCILAREHRDDFAMIPVVPYDEFSEDMADMIIISSYQDRIGIKQELRKLSLNTEIIDIYEEMEKSGLPLTCEFWLV